MSDLDIKDIGGKIIFPNNTYTIDFDNKLLQVKANSYDFTATEDCIIMQSTFTDGRYPTYLDGISMITIFPNGNIINQIILRKGQRITCAYATAYAFGLKY